MLITLWHSSFILTYKALEKEENETIKKLDTGSQEATTVDLRIRCLC